jgi:surface carbohydrate biosynthesis protein
MVIIIPIEVKVRELLSKSFLAYKIKQSFNNCKIILGSQRDIFNRIKLLKNTIWLDKNTFYNKISKNKALRNNYKIMLDEEGPHSMHSKIYLDLRLNKKILKFYDKIIFWGKNDLKKKQKNCYVFGHPKYDLLKKPYNEIFSKKIAEIKKKYKKNILIASSFEFDCLDERLEKRLIQINSSNKSAAEKYVSAKEKYFKNYENQILLTKELAYKCPDVNIIYRPHPIQKIELVKKRFGEIPQNLHIIFKDTITPWIGGCEIYIHSGCSTYLEAYLLKKKIVNFFSTKIPKQEKFSYAGKTFYNTKECINYIKYIIDKKELSYKANKKINNIVFNLNKKKYFYKEFNTFLQNYKSINSKIIFGKNKKTIKDLFLLILSYIKNKIFLKTFLFYFMPEQWLYSKEHKLRKFNFLKKNELSKIINQFYDLDKKKNIKPRIKYISKNVFMLH